VFGRDVLTVNFEIDDNEGRRLIVSGALANSRTDELATWAKS